MPAIIAPDPSTTSRATAGGMIGNNSAGTIVVANGFSCRHQIQDALGVVPKHFVEVVVQRALDHADF